MRSSPQHIVIAGAGIIGLAIALELAATDAIVTVLERGRAMQQASWAAAGMLAVDDPENSPELHTLAGFSRSLYPSFLDRIEQLTGIPVPLRTHTTFQGQRVAGAARTPHAELRGDRYDFHRLDEASLDPRDLCETLPAAARAAGVTLLEYIGVTRVQRDRSRNRLRIETGHTPPIRADSFILAAGAWSPQITLPPDALEDLPLPIAPRKGQAIEITLPPDSEGLAFVVRTPELYLVPRGDGRVVIGATLEHAGFDRSIDEAAGDTLWQAAGELWPPILEGRVSARWTGLRPGFEEGSVHSLPVIGSLGDNLWAATAHFRNGILLAPATAHLLRELIAGESPSVAIEAFSPRRFVSA